MIVIVLVIVMAVVLAIAILVIVLRILVEALNNLLFSQISHRSNVGGRWSSPGTSSASR